jgi:phosphoglucomutase
LRVDQIFKEERVEKAVQENDLQGKYLHQLEKVLDVSLLTELAFGLQNELSSILGRVFFDQVRKSSQQRRCSLFLPFFIIDK